MAASVEALNTLKNLLLYIFSCNKNSSPFSFFITYMNLFYAYNVCLALYDHVQSLCLIAHDNPLIRFQSNVEKWKDRRLGWNLPRA